MNENVNMIIDKLAEKLQVPAEVLWGALLKQAPIDGVISIIISLLVVILLPISGYFLYKVIHKIAILEGESKYDEQPKYIGLSIVLSIIAIIFFFGSMVAALELSDNLAGIINPEYWALKEIMRIF